MQIDREDTTNTNTNKAKQRQKWKDKEKEREVERERGARGKENTWIALVATEKAMGDNLTFYSDFVFRRFIEMVEGEGIVKGEK